MLTPIIKTVEIPGVVEDPGSYWKIRALEINGTSIAKADLVKMAVSERQNFRKIQRALRVIASEKNCPHQQYLRKCHNQLYKNVYEAKAQRHEARVMFFYSDKQREIVCTNTCWKTSDNQDKAFKDCSEFRDFYNTYAPKH